MTISAEQKRVIDCILSLNETGKLPSKEAYSSASVLKGADGKSDGAGISYGKHQSTDKSDSLDAICLRYIDLKGSRAPELSAFLPDLDKDFSATVDPSNLPQRVQDLIKLLKELGQDPTMQKAQDEVFDERYWLPAYQKAVSAGCKLALSYLVLYDTCIQSGPGRIDSLRNKFPEKSPASGGDEKAWLIAFLKARRNFLTSSSNLLVQKSVYRVDAMMEIANAGNWDLKTPLTYRKTLIK